jgi:hypothetical protein
MIRVIAHSLIFLGSTSALAGSPVEQVRLEASFLELRSKCAEFVANPQMKPVSAKLYCSDQHFLWRPVDPGQASLRNFRQIGAQLDLKTYSTSQEFKEGPIADTAFNCPNFVKVQRTVPSIEVELSCSDFLNIQDLHSFCDVELNRREQVDANIVEEKILDEIVSFCPKTNS